MEVCEEPVAVAEGASGVGETPVEAPPAVTEATCRPTPKKPVGLPKTPAIASEATVQPAPKKRIGRPKNPNTIDLKAQASCKDCGMTATNHHLKYRHKCPQATVLPKAPSARTAPERPPPEPIEPPKSREQLVLEYLRDQRQLQKERKQNMYKSMTASFLM